MIQYRNTFPSRRTCIGCNCLKEEDGIRCSLVENKYVLTVAAVVVLVTAEYNDTEVKFHIDSVKNVCIFLIYCVNLTLKAFQW
jgi:hypothetical protein